LGNQQFPVGCFRILFETHAHKGALNIAKEFSVLETAPTVENHEKVQFREHFEVSISLA